MNASTPPLAGSVDTVEAVESVDVARSPAGGETGEEAFARGLALHLARWAEGLGAGAALAQTVAQLGQALARAVRRGHVCLPLAAAWREGCTAQDSPSAPPSRAALLASGVVGTQAAPDACPLILDDEDRLYLHRDYDLEQRLARRLALAACAEHAAHAAQAAPVTAAASATPASPASPAAPATSSASAASSSSAASSAPAPLPLTLGVDTKSQAHGDTPDWQRVATALALRRRLLVISGGPGTGKTSTVVQLLAAVLRAQPEVRIALVAPTGKAAARLAEAVRERAQHLPAELRARLPARASTVHRLLGVTPQGFVHHAGRLLALDLLVVDEASMLDLALATQLLEALPRSARIVLLGDQHQLAAVESGAVFAELAADPSLSAACRSELEAACALAPGSLHPPAARHGGALPDSVVWFERNYRFAADSGIGQLATQIRHGHIDAALQTLRRAQDGAQDDTPGDAQDDAHADAQDDAQGAELQWWDDAAVQPAAAVQRHWRQGYARYLQALLRAPDDIAALAQAFAAYRVLCAHRQGPRGMQAVNAALDAHALHVLAPWLAQHPPLPGSRSYPGRPVMVLSNQPQLQLFNGDIGITLPPARGESGPVVAFVQADGSVRRVPLARLPEHQSAWALTVHKAQGSEFDRVLVLLPAGASPVLTRELLYTAVTRARQRVALAGSAAVLSTAIATPTHRYSGLAARLCEALAAHTASPP